MSYIKKVTVHNKALYMLSPHIFISNFLHLYLQTLYRDFTLEAHRTPLNSFFAVYMNLSCKEQALD